MLILRMIFGLVRRKITAGRSDEIIIDQIRQKYGDYVLFNPPLTVARYFVACSDWVRRARCDDHCASRRKLSVTASPDHGASDRIRIEPCWSATMKRTDTE